MKVFSLLELLTDLTCWTPACYDQEGIFNVLAYMLVGVAGVCRFDRLVYLDITDDVDSKILVLRALTRGCVSYHMILRVTAVFICSIHLHDDVSLEAVAKACPSNTTGADLYALCNGATKISLRRTINELEAKGVIIIAMITLRLVPQY